VKKYIIFGVSAFLSDIFDIIHANGARVAQIFLNMPERRPERVIGYRERVARLGYDIEVHETLTAFKPQKGFSYTLGTPSPHKNKLVEELKNKFFLTFNTLIHPTAFLGSNVHAGEGVIINVNATVGPNAFLNDFCVINRCVSIGHDSNIGKHALIGPNAAIAGSVTIGECATIAMKATVIDRIHIGSWSVIGAGSLVTKDVPSEVVAYGVPAKVVRDNEEKDFQKYKDNRSNPQSLLSKTAI
jgi:sugar O-acyltransferase (sialic acid O-acetyltransferase NeuD family)